MTDHETPRLDHFEDDRSITEVAHALAEASPLRRIGRAAVELVTGVTKIVLNGNAGDAIKESANHLS